MAEINWIFKRIDGGCVKADSNAYRHNSDRLLNTLKMSNLFL